MDESTIKGFVYRKRLLFDMASGVADFTELKCESGNLATLKLEKIHPKSVVKNLDPKLESEKPEKSPLSDDKDLVLNKKNSTSSAKMK